MTSSKGSFFVGAGSTQHVLASREQPPLHRSRDEDRDAVSQALPRRQGGRARQGRSARPLRASSRRWIPLLRHGEGRWGALDVQNFVSAREIEGREI